MQIDLGIRYDAVLHWKVVSSDSFEMHVSLAPSLSLGDLLESLSGKAMGRINSLLEKVDLTLTVQFQARSPSSAVQLGSLTQYNSSFVPCICHHV